VEALEARDQLRWLAKQAGIALKEAVTQAAAGGSSPS